MPFYFQQFAMEHHRSTMKIGTDALLLSALLPAQKAENVLEIGVGCGVISLLLAQRYSRACIHGVEIDFPSVCEAQENYRRSPFKDRLSVQHISVQDYARSSVKSYDLIVSNPPFFSHSLKSPLKRRSSARHSDETLTFQELFECVSILLTDGGTFSMIIPPGEMEMLLPQMAQNGLYIHEDHMIFSRPCKVIRHVLTMGKILRKTIFKSFYLRNGEGDFTSEYKNCMSPYLISVK